MKLNRHLSLLHVFCIAAGAMISSGIFVLPGLAHAQAGPAVIVSYFLAGLLAATGMLSMAELATAMPKAGGDYFFVTRGLGPAVGSVSGLLTWFSLSLKSAFALVGLVAFTARFTSINTTFIGIILCAFFAGLNLFGSKHAARTQVLIVLVLFALMIYYIFKGIPAMRVMHFEPFMPHGGNSVLLTAGFVFVSYGGLVAISSIAEEVKDPGRVIPLAMILALLVVSILYTLMVMVTTGVLPGTQLDNSLTPIADGAAVFMSPTGQILIGFAAILAFLSTANGGILSASRYLLALSRDELIPPFFGRISKRHNTPYTAVIITGVFVAATLFLNLKILVEAASLVLLLGYVLSCICVIILREGRLQNYRPRFRSPLYPLPQIAGIIGCSMLVFEMGMEAFLISVFLTGAGFTFYWFYGRKRAQKDYALLHLIERFTSRELVTGTLERELKDIIRERDDIVIDRFDQLVTDSAVLDLDEEMSSNDFFHRAAEIMSTRLGIPEKEIFHKLVAREEDSSTVIHPSLAIPHILIKGTNRFDMLIARNKSGIHFKNETVPVNTVIMLMGSKDERNMHLRALAAIAQICQEEDIKPRWLAAKNDKGLRDILLLAKRRR